MTDPLLLVGLLLGSQGAIGGAQYAMELPEGLVWLHVVVATLTWNALLWAIFVAGRPAGHISQGDPSRVEADRVAVGA